MNIKCVTKSYSVPGALVDICNPTIQGQKIYEFKSNLSYMVRLCLTKQNKRGSRGWRPGDSTYPVEHLLSMHEDLGLTDLGFPSVCYE